MHFQPVKGRDIGRVGDRHDQSITPPLQRNQIVFDREIARQTGYQFRIKDFLVEIDKIVLELGGQGLGQFHFSEHPGFDPGLAEPFAAVLLLFQHQIDFRRGDRPHVGKNPANLLSLIFHRQFTAVIRLFRPVGRSGHTWQR